MTTVLKVGGSLITDKTEPESIDRGTLDRVATELATATPDAMAIVHGGGSFGHPVAAAHGLSDRQAVRDPRAINAVVAAMTTLHGAVLEALTDAGLPAVSVPPRAAYRKRQDGSLDGIVSPTAALIAEGFVPVLHGDVVVHADAGCSIASGDAIALQLADALEVDRLGLCTGVSGVLDRNGEVVDRIDRFADVADAIDDPSGTDVTGGMAGKVRIMLDVPAPASIFGVDDLDAFLAGGRPGTTVGGQ